MEHRISRLFGALSLPRCRSAAAYYAQLRRSSTSTSSSGTWQTPPVWTNVAEDEIAKLAAMRRRPLMLEDLLKLVDYPVTYHTVLFAR